MITIVIVIMGCNPCHHTDHIRLHAINQVRNFSWTDSIIFFILMPLMVNNSAQHYLKVQSFTQTLGIPLFSAIVM